MMLLRSGWEPAFDLLTYEPDNYQLDIRLFWSSTGELNSPVSSGLDSIFIQHLSLKMYNIALTLALLAMRSGSAFMITCKVCTPA